MDWVDGTIKKHSSLDIGQDLAAIIENPDFSCTMTCTSLIPQQYNSFYLKPITESEVFRYLQQLNPAKSPGPNTNNIRVRYHLSISN